MLHHQSHKTQMNNINNIFILIPENVFISVTTEDRITTHVVTPTPTPPTQGISILQTEIKKSFNFLNNLIILH